ncbi:MAG: sugar ABC transporter permease [Treponema sp.]|jgi:multiple sugar transport system permease protein|nr:sugar ABC transporter permease [Treponema sp.]
MAAETNTLNRLWKKHRIGLFFITPAGLMVLVFAVYPMLYTVYLSFFKHNMASGTARRFIGAANYINLLRDSQFLNSIFVTLVYTFWGVLFTMIFGVLLALLLNKDGFVPGILRSVSLMPMLICSAALSVAWVLMYNYSFGVLNAVLTAVGLPKMNFLGEIKTALPSLIILDVWQFTPYVMILVLAGLKGIPTELYEAAAIDGANKVQSFFRITLPSLRSVLITTLIMRVIDTFKTFEKPFMMTNGGPALSTDTINLHVYNTAFISYEMGYGSAGALIITLLIALLSIVFMKFAGSFQD